VVIAIDATYLLLRHPSSLSIVTSDEICAAFNRELSLGEEFISIRGCFPEWVDVDEKISETPLFREKNLQVVIEN
jgi:hypothetical protein